MGQLIYPGEIGNNGYVKFGGRSGGGNKKHYGLCESSELKIGQEVQYTTTVIPRRNWKQWLCKIWGGEGGRGVNKKHYGLYESSELKIGQELQYTILIHLQLVNKLSLMDK